MKGLKNSVAEFSVANLWCNSMLLDVNDSVLGIRR